MARKTRFALLPILVCALTGAALAQGAPDTEQLLTAQKDAMTVLDAMDGVWHGSAWILSPDGTRTNLTQTERVGPFLDGAVKVIEGRGYGENGQLAFNAFGIVSFDPAEGAYAMRSYAQGRMGDFPVTPTEDGFTWEIPAGPATIRYQATLQNGTWHEVGERVVEGQEPFRFFEMTLERVGDAKWPALGAIGPLGVPELMFDDPHAGEENFTPPKVLERTKDPQYSDRAREERTIGVVILRAVIDEKGKIDDLYILKGLPHGLSEAAKKAVRTWKFAPAQKDGKPVKANFNLTVNFSLQ